MTVVYCFLKEESIADDEKDYEEEDAEKEPEKAVEERNLTPLRLSVKVNRVKDDYSVIKHTTKSHSCYDHKRKHSLYVDEDKEEPTSSHSSSKKGKREKRKKREQAAGVAATEAGEKAVPPVKKHKKHRQVQ